MQESYSEDKLWENTKSPKIIPRQMVPFPEGRLCGEQL